jgi:multiple sugar transport system substrate-binding protein
MRRYQVAASAASAILLCAAATACGGGSSTGGGGDNSSPKTLTYWASNQGPDIATDKRVLGPELKKFEKQTGIKVKLEVISWNDLQNRILTATSSGQGPDVLNIGNTWAASLQATGALLPFDSKTLAKIGGKSRFEPTAMEATGASGKPPVSIPLYSLAYALYYNKQMFQDAGLSGPPKTWDELVTDAKKLTQNGKYGLGLEAGNYRENAHHAFILGKQHGANFFKGETPTFDTPGTVAAVKQYVDFMAQDKVVAPGDAEYTNNQTLADFASGRAAMILWQAADSSLLAHGMKQSDYGVAPIPFQTANPSGNTAIDTMVAGINLSVFKNTHNLDGALKFVKFMTSTSEQEILNKAFGSLPPVTTAQRNKAFDTPSLAVLRNELAQHAAPLPEVPNEDQFETLVGNAMKNLFADAANGRPVTDATVKSALDNAQKQLTN